MLVSFREGIPQISDHLFQVKANMKQMKQFTTYRHPKTRQATWSHTAANKRGINLLPLPMVLHTICANDDSWELHGRMASWEGDTCNRYKSELVVEPKNMRPSNWVKIFPKIGMNMKKLKPPSSKYIVYTCFYVLLHVIHPTHEKKQNQMVFVSAGHSPSSLPSCCPGQTKHTKCVRGSGQSSYLTIHCSARCFLRMWGGI